MLVSVYALRAAHAPAGTEPAHMVRYFMSQPAWLNEVMTAASCSCQVVLLVAIRESAARWQSMLAVFQASSQYGAGKLMVMTFSRVSVVRVIGSQGQVCMQAA
jgi:hypothetical protein